MSFVRTVLGDIDPADLGVTNAHEHLLCKAGPHLASTPEGLADLELSDLDKTAAELELFKQSGGSAMLAAGSTGRGASDLPTCVPAHAPISATVRTRPPTIALLRPRPSTSP